MKSHLLIALAILTIPQVLYAQDVQTGTQSDGSYITERKSQIDENYTFRNRYDDDYGAYKQALNAQSIRRRDDLLWHAESAGVVYYHTGNVSLLSATRFGLTDRVELSTFIVEDALRTSLYAKVLWKATKPNSYNFRSGGFSIIDKNVGNSSSKKRGGIPKRKNTRWFLTSRFDVANSYLGMKLCQSLEVDRIISPDAEIPLVFEIGHEFLASKAWYTDQNCSDGSVYFILTFGLGLYGGFNFSSVDDLPQAQFHFMANRGETTTGDGFRARLKVWLDGRLSKRWNIHGGLYYHCGTFKYHHALELQAEGEFFFSNKWSGKIGFLTSFANYTKIESHAAIWPIIDVSYYFGKRKLRSGTLYQKGVYPASKF